MKSPRKKIRAHVVITTDQKEGMLAIARERAMTLSGVIREAVDRGLPSIIAETDERTALIHNQEQQALNIQKRIMAGEEIKEAMRANHLEFA